MPTYEYRCSACRHEFETFQSMKDAPKRKCPACGKSALERLIGTGAAILFKGSGFYETDYRSESYRKAAEADKPADPKQPETKAGDAKREPGPSADATPTATKPNPATPSPSTTASSDSSTSGRSSTNSAGRKPRQAATPAASVKSPRGRSKAAGTPAKRPGKP